MRHKVRHFLCLVSHVRRHLKERENTSASCKVPAVIFNNLDSWRLRAFLWSGENSSGKWLQLLLFTDHFSALEWPRRYPLIWMFRHTCYPARMPDCSVDRRWSSSTPWPNTSALRVPCSRSLTLQGRVPTLCLAVSKLLRKSTLLSSGKCIYSLSASQLIPIQSQRAALLLRSLFDKRLGELWPSSLLPDRKSLQKVLKTLNTLWNFCYTCEVLDIQWTLTWE